MNPEGAAERTVRAVGDRGTVLQLSTMIPPARFGGAERVVASFGEELTHAGFRVVNQGLRERSGDGPGLPIPNLYWPFDGRSRGPALRLAWHAVDALALRARSTVARLVDEVAPDVIVTHNLRGWGLAPWAVAEQRGIALVHVVHDYGLLCNASTLWHSGAECGTLCNLRRASAIRRWPGGLLIGVSAAVLDEHRRLGFGATNPSAVIHPVAAAQQLRPSARLRTDTVPRTFGFLGRLTSEKGIGHLVDAVAATGAQLIVAGDGEAAEVAQLKSRAPAQVDFRGWVAPEAFFDDIDVLVVPSLWKEPFGLVVAEAAQAGVPVLLADQPGLIEAARTSGARHRVYPAADVTELRSALALPVSEYCCHKSDFGADIVEAIRGVLPGGGR